MCGDFGDYEYRGSNKYHEDWGNIQAEMDENKTNEEAQREYDEKHRCW